MLRFSRLRLAGFKSFVDPTELPFADGVTAVVGPNGCGKSNLLEALRWGMGENSARRMRGGEMDDVIFAGTNDRPARNLAEVSIALDNGGRAAPAQFNDEDELEIVRRIERGRGSNYKVNGREARARDIQMMFADAATGAQSGSLVSQNQIAALIAAKPADRRRVLEDAAGVSGLRTRRSEAESKLKSAETNLGQLDHVLTEMEKQRESLTGQAEQAARYRKISEEIRTAEAALLHLRWSRAMAELANARTAEAEAARLVEARTAEAARATTTAEERGAGLPALRAAEAQAAEALQALAAAAERLEAEDRRIADRSGELSAQIARADDDAAREKALAGEAETAGARLGDEIAALEQAGAGRADRRTQAAAAVREAEAATSRAEAAQAEAARAVAAAEAEARRLAHAATDARSRADRLARNRDEARAAQEKLAAEDETAATAAAAEAARAEAEAAATRAAEALEDAEAMRAAAREAARAADAERREARAARDRLAAEAEGLRASLARPKGADADPAVDSARPPQGLEAAFAAAIGAEGEAPAAGDAPDAQRRWEALPPCPADAPWPAGLTPLGDQVTAPPALARVIAQTALAESREQALAAQPDLPPGRQIVTADGGCFRWDGLVVEAGAPNPAAQRLARRNRLDALEAQRETAQAAFAKLDAKAEDLEAGEHAAAETEKAAREALKTARSAADEARRRAAAAAEQATRQSAKLQSAADLAVRLGKDAEEAEAAALAAAQAAADAPAPDAARATTESAGAEAVAARAALVEARTNLSALDVEAKAEADRRAVLDRDRADWGRRAAEAGKRLAAIGERRAAAETELTDLANAPARLAAEKEALAERRAGQDGERRRAADALAQGETAAREAEAAARQAEKAAADAREDRLHKDAALREAETRRAGIVEQAQEKLGCPAHQIRDTLGLSEEALAEPIEKIDDRLRRRVRERDAMGPVNLRAERELAEIVERLEAMTAERADLEQAIARLRHALSTLNREARERLAKAFDAVNARFSDLFSRLFGGGQARLELTDPDDPLETGLEIYASPPGKRLQALSLLSGGEQALTATALLFAAFLANPSPICVLDEVDAPLDDSNVQRFCDLVAEIAATTGTRFLVITHHRVTMARADRLFGVTMAERGVSSLVSVDLETAEALRETG